MKHLTHAECKFAADRVALMIANCGLRRAYPIPRGGVPAAYLVKGHMPALTIVETSEEADCYIDDLIDSGATAERYNDKPFYALFSKQTAGNELADSARAGVFKSPGEWLVFPWEKTQELSTVDICTRLLQFIGEDPERQGLEETPARFAKAWGEWTRGYKQNPDDLFKVFDDGAENYDEMILVKNIPIYSHCEHHLAAIFGVAHIAYIPNGKIVGLSKLARVADVFARRLQVQERLTSQIADAIEKNLQPLGVAVVVEARHFCMESRGVEKMGSATTTSAMRGKFRTNPETRAEFMSLVSK